MSTYPVFPNWVFEGKLELDNEMKAMILQQVASMQKVQLHFGPLILKDKYEYFRICPSILIDFH